jgi:hypothetical protein
MSPHDEAEWQGLESWNYRVVRTEDPGGVSYAIDEVCDDADGRPHARTVDPAHPTGETLAALDQPVLEDAVFDGAT